MFHPRPRLLASLLASAAIAAPLSAGDRLIVAGYGGVVLEADTDVGVFEPFAPSCWGSIEALATDRRRIYAGGDTGLIEVHDLVTGELKSTFWPGLGPIEELAAAGGK